MTAHDNRRIELPSFLLIQIYNFDGFTFTHKHYHFSIPADKDTKPKRFVLDFTSLRCMLIVA